MIEQEATYDYYEKFSDVPPETLMNAGARQQQLCQKSTVQ